jgi:hypothetical protein
MPIPKKIPPPPVDFTYEKGVELIDALQIMLPKDLGLSDVAAKNKLKTKNYSWQSPKVLSDYAKGITSQGNIKDAEYVLRQWQENYTEVPKYEEFTMTGAPKYAVDSNTLTPEKLKEFQEKGEGVEEKRKATIASAESDVRAAIKRKQEIYADQIKRAEVAKKEFEKQTKFVEVKEAKLAEDEQNQIEILRQQSKSDPKAAVKTVSEELQKRLGDSVPVEARNIAALNVVVSLQSGYAPVIQTAVTDKVSQEIRNDRNKEVMDWVEALQTRSDAEISMSKDIALKAFGPDFQKAVFPDVEVSDSPQSGFIPVSLAYLPSEATKTIEQKSQILDNPFLTETNYSDKWFGSQLAMLNGDGSEVQGSVSFVYFKSQGRVNWPETGGPSRMGQITGTGEALGVVKGLAGGVAKKAVAKGLTKAIVGFFSKIAAPETAGLSLAIAAAVNWVIDKVGQKNIKKWFLLALGLPTVAAGALIGIPLATAFGTGMVVFGLARALGITPAALGQGVGAFMGAVFAATLGAIGTPILIALIGFPVAVSLILFIINSGAYVVPQGDPLFGTVNIVCDTSENGDQTPQDSGSTAANAAVCIVSYLNQFHLNPLYDGLLNSRGWNALTEVLPEPALEALRASAPVDGHLQCVGFVSATAGLAYGQNFGQTNACNYIGNPPPGYRYVSGTGGMKSGDFFVIDGDGGCSRYSPGHIGVVISVDGALISCADANYVGPGKARVDHGCFSLSKIAGYLRK